MNMRSRSDDQIEGFGKEMHLMLGLFIMALNWTWAFVSYTTPLLCPPGSTAFEEMGLLIAGTAGMAAFFLGCGAFQKHVATVSGNRMITAIALASSTLSGALFACGAFLYIGTLGNVCAWLLGSIASASILMRLGAFYATIEKFRAEAYVALTLIIAGIFYLTLTSMNEVLAAVVVCVLLVAAAALSAFLPVSFADVAQRGSDRDKPFRVALAKDAPFGSKIYFFVMFFYGISFGFASFVGTAYSEPSVGSLLSSQIAYALAGVFMMCAVLWFKDNLNLPLFQWVLLLLIVAGMLPLSFFGEGAVASLCYMLLLFGFACYDAVNWLMLAELSRAHNPIFTFGFGRGLLCLGLLVGRLAGWVPAYHLGLSDIFFTMIPLIIVLLLFCSVIFLSMPMLKRSMPELEPEPESSEPKRRWSDACDALCVEHGLTAREREVFRLLAKGRDLKTIHEKLVISPHTAKAHITHIYQKLGIHSRQELINMVDERSHEDSPPPNPA